MNGQGAQENVVVGFLMFRKYITPYIVIGLFALGVLACVIFGIVSIVKGIQYGSGMAVLMGVLQILLGPIFVRVSCEVLAVFFRIYDTLVEIKNAQGR